MVCEDQVVEAGAARGIVYLRSKDSSSAQWSKPLTWLANTSCVVPVDSYDTRGDADAQLEC